MDSNSDGSADRVQPVRYGVEAFTSDSYAREEAEKMWPKVWQHACRLEEIPNVGDYITYDVAEETILIVRSDAETISAFYNVCSHRGRRLVDAPPNEGAACGNTRQFRCQYHGWCYDLKGRPTFILDESDWRGAISKNGMKISEVQVDTWGGWVWINMDPQAESLRDYLAQIPELADPFEIDKMRYRWRQWCYFDCNWKVALEAFSEAYHVTGAHPHMLKFADFYTWSRSDGKHSNKGFTERDADLRMDESNTYYRAGRGRDARVSIAALQEHVYRTANASTTQTMVDAAKRLVDELPEDTPPAEVMAHWMKSAREDDAARGVIWPTIEPEHLAKVGNSVHIFPNLSIGLGISFALVYRVRPYGTDPNKCMFEACMLERYAEGEEPQTEWTYVDPDDDRWPIVLREDFANMRQVQKGMKSRGFRGAVPNPLQEEPVTNLHRTLAEYVGRGAPEKLGDEFK